jgi:hypothetical protein
MDTLDQDSSIESLLLKLKLVKTANRKQDFDDSGPKFPFPFPNSFDIICLKSETEVDSLRAFDETKVDLLNELLKINNQDGSLHHTKTLDSDYIENEFAVHFAQANYQPFIAKLKIEDFNSEIEVYPKPETYIGFF